MFFLKYFDYNSCLAGFVCLDILTSCYMYYLLQLAIVTLKVTIKTNSNRWSLRLVLCQFILSLCIFYATAMLAQSLYQEH